MGRKCVVPYCHGGYDSTKKEREGAETERKVTVFSFPKDEDLKKKWIAKIPRKFWSIGKNSGVCEKHFHDCDILYTRDDSSARR